MIRIAGIEPHPIVLAVPEGYNLHISNIIDWVEYNDKERKRLARLARKGEKGALAKSLEHEGYLKEIKHYLRTGDWISDFFGRYEESKTYWKVIRKGHCNVEE